MFNRFNEFSRNVLANHPWEDEFSGTTIDRAYAFKAWQRQPYHLSEDAEMWVCWYCAYWEHYDPDYSEPLSAEALAIFKRLAAGEIDPGDDIDCHDSLSRRETEAVHNLCGDWPAAHDVFSNIACDCCKSKLGGSRYPRKTRPDA